MQDRPEIPKEDYEKPLPKGDLPPLPLLPDREWLKATIINVEYRIAMFNGVPQYLTKKVEGGDDEPILDEDGNQIQRREFNIKFEIDDYTLPNGDPRCAWLTIGASFGEKAHLPTLAFNVLGAAAIIETPLQLINGLTGKRVRLQLKNKPNKDSTKQPWQNVIYDAVEAIGKPQTTEPPEPMGDDPDINTEKLPF